MILASVPRRPHNVCRAERYNRQLPTQLINLTIYTVCERHALMSHNSGYYGYGSAVSPERGARLSGRSLAEHVAVSILGSEGKDFRGRRLSKPLLRLMLSDVYGMHACVHPCGGKEGEIYPRGTRRNTELVNCSGRRNAPSDFARRSIGLFPLCSLPLRFRITVNRPLSHTRKVYMPGILERIDAIARIISNVPRLWSSLRRVPWQWTRGRTQSVWLRKFTRFCAIIVWPIIVRTTKGKFRERLWCIVCWGSVTKSVRDVSKLHKYVYIERNINDDVNKQFVITMKIVIRVFENIRNERDGI